MLQQRIPKNLEEGEDTFEFLDEIPKGDRKKCRYGKSCNQLCINNKAICHIRFASELNPALDRMRNFLANRKVREEAIAVAAEEMISAFRTQISQP